jgi:hypothetical protein
MQSMGRRTSTMTLNLIFDKRSVIEWTLRHPSETVFSALSKIGGLVAALKIIGFFVQLYHERLFRKDLEKLLVQPKQDKRESIIVQ